MIAPFLRKVLASNSLHSCISIKCKNSKNLDMVPETGHISGKTFLEVTSLSDFLYPKLQASPQNRTTNLRSCVLVILGGSNPEYH
jgi:hypothetical protein